MSIDEITFPFNDIENNELTGILLQKIKLGPETMSIKIIIDPIKNSTSYVPNK